MVVPSFLARHMNFVDPSVVPNMPFAVAKIRYNPIAMRPWFQEQRRQDAEDEGAPE
jgi:hypothetical protein